MVRRRNWLPSLIWLIPHRSALVGIALVARILMDRGPEVGADLQDRRRTEGQQDRRPQTRTRRSAPWRAYLAGSPTARRALTVQFEQGGRTPSPREDTRFWAVRPRLDTSGISGLEHTAARGAYIGADAGTSEENAQGIHRRWRRRPSSRETPRASSSCCARRTFGSLDIGSPAYFSRIKAGQLAAYELDGDGGGDRPS